MNFLASKKQFIYNLIENSLSNYFLNRPAWFEKIILKYILKNDSVI